MTNNTKRNVLTDIKLNRKVYPSMLDRLSISSTLMFNKSTMLQLRKKRGGNYIYYG